MVVCDPLRIRQVLTNLIGNAIRYSPPATSIVVSLALEWADQLAARHLVLAPGHLAADGTDRDELLAVVSVQDQGAGISADQAARLFKRYARGQERRGEGLGLGLYLSREFVTRHGGALWVEGQPGHGSTFYVALPLEQPQQDEPEL
jgi:two-component system phosphate regulon sensor histidine kinase PhoR